MISVGGRPNGYSRTAKGYLPRVDDVPVQFRIPSPVELRENLIAGELRHVDGAFEEVYSPVCIRSPAGLQRQRIGSFPLMTEVEALEVLNAAVAAYDNGRGLWPTMTVGKRIRHVQLFAARMKERRDDVVRLLMWEIGKTLKDAEKEFDRTLTYIADTVDASRILTEVRRASPSPKGSSGRSAGRRWG